MASEKPMKDLRAKCEFYAEKYNYKRTDLEHGLEAYVAHLFAQEPGFDAVLEGRPTTEADLGEYICRGNDLQVDCVLHDEIGKRIILGQATWRSKTTLDEDKVVAFFDVPDRILNEDYRDTGGAQIQELLAGFAERVADGWEVVLRFVTNRPVGERQKLQEAVNAKNRAYEDAERAITCELYGPSELLRLENDLKSAILGGHVPEVVLTFQSDHFIELDSPYRTIVGVIKANELVDLYNQKGMGLALFNMNVRLPLTSTKVNPVIVSTAQSPTEGPHFFYYNNGISAVCGQYEMDNNTLKAKRFQIINGAQTLNALVKARRKNANADVYVLFRLTETAESYGGPFTDSIIKYNNTQNPVRVADFVANDPIQLWLRDNFTKISGRGPVPTMYYVHKSGYRPPGSSGRGLKIEQLAGIRHAFIYGPVASYKEPAQFFDRGGRYKEAFGVDGEIVDFWTLEELYKCGAAIAVHEDIQRLSKRLKADSKAKDTDEAKYLYRLARYMTALVGVGLETMRATTFKDYATLTASQATFDTHVQPVIAAARSVLRHEYRNRKGTAVQPEYNLARDEEAWKRLSDAVRDEVVASAI